MIPLVAAISTSSLSSAPTSCMEPTVTKGAELTRPCNQSHPTAEGPAAPAQKVGMGSAPGFGEAR